MKYIAQENLVALARIFNKHSYSLYLVGGAVRDYILKKENSDYDLTTSATPDEVKVMFKRTIDTGIKHGTVTVIFSGEHYEITTFRTEGDYSDSRHPDSVTFVRSLEEDLKRRDFTINALACDIITGEIIDLHGGTDDLEKGIIRAIGIPEDRFNEDALRMFRACRFAAKLDFTIEENTLKAIKSLHGNIRKVSVERIKDEMDKLLLSPCPVRGLEYLENTGLMEEIIPEITLTNSLKEAIRRAKENNLPLTSLYAILFSGMSAQDTEKALIHLKASNREKKEITLLSSGLGNIPYDNTPVSIRRLIKKYGKENILPLFTLRRAYGYTEEEDIRYEEKVKEELEKDPALEIKDLDITGKDLEAIVKPGPEMGRMLNYLLDEVIKNPRLNNRDDLLKLASHGF